MVEARRAKEQAIRDLFDRTPTRYYQLLNELIDRPEALVHDPMLSGACAGCATSAPGHGRRAV